MQKENLKEINDSDDNSKTENFLDQTSTEMLPSEVVSYLDRFIVAQSDAKKAVALALRSRWRRLQLQDPMRQEITPKNILMIGPTGVGKTEIARRLAKLIKAPFIKVEASKFTEVGYIGRDVESIIRDLVDSAHSMVREEYRENMRESAKEAVEDQLLKLIIKSRNKDTINKKTNKVDNSKENNPSGKPEELSVEITSLATNEISKVLTDQLLQEEILNLANKSEYSSDDVLLEDLSASDIEQLKDKLSKGELEEEEIEVDVVRQISTHVEILGPNRFSDMGFSEMEGQLKDMFSQIIPKTKDKKALKIREAREFLLEESLDKLLDPDEIKRIAIHKAENSGIVFIDEIDKITGGGAQSRGPDVSREGVQRDLLPLVEGSTVSTRSGHVRTDHILFIASGAFHFSKPSDLMPEFQGRFPIRVELESLNSEHFYRILQEPDTALPKQYCALLKTEEVELDFSDDGLKEIASIAAEVNERIENIGARRLHTLLEKILEDISFDADKLKNQTIVIDKAFVKNKLSNLIKDNDISRFIL